MKCFEILGIQRTRDKKAIRHAYAGLVKIYHLETHPREFEQIKEAYNQAMEYADSEDYFEENSIAGFNDFQLDDIKPDEFQHKYAERKEEAEDSFDTIIEDVEEFFAEHMNRTEDEEEEPLGNIFYNTTLENIYGATRKLQLQNLEGFEKIKHDLNNQRVGGYKYFKEYVLSHEFIKYQYDKFYIKMLAKLLTECAEILNSSQLMDMFLPFGIMYGLFSEINEAFSYAEIRHWNLIEDADRVAEDIFKDEIKPLIDFAKVYSDFDILNARLKKEEIRFFIIAANKYRKIAIGYGTGYYTPTASQWKNALYYMDYEVYPGVKIKNDFSIWIMIERLILTHTNIDLDTFITMEEVFHLADAMQTSKKKIYEPVVRAIETVTNMKIEILAGKEAYINTAEDYSKLLRFIVIKGEVESLIRACKKDVFLEARKGEIFSTNLINMLQNKVIDYEVWTVLFESYYFTSKNTDVEKEVMYQLNRYRDYAELYWQKEAVHAMNYGREKKDGCNRN